MNLHANNRRDFIRTLGAGLAAAAFSNGNAYSQNAKRPNFIIILADDLGYGDIEGFGNSKIGYHTPALNRLASEGVKLTQVYVPVPYCAPSRASLLTGRYPFRNGVVHNPCPDAGVNNIGLPESEITIAEALKPAGYATCCIGKWHLGHRRRFLPTNQGFDEYFGILYSNDMRPVQLVENESVYEYPVYQPTLTRRYTERALDFIQRSHDAGDPFFLYLPHAMPHKPLAASEEFYTPETPDDLYADVIRELDWSVDRILEKVKSLGIDDDTMILFLSDNGPWYGGDTGGLRGMKALTWDGGLRVPFIGRWPGKIPAGSVQDAPAGTIDVFPTILKLAGVKLPHDREIDGVDIMPLLTGENTGAPHEYLFALKGVNLAMVRSGPWKLHLHSPGGIPNRGDDWIDPRGPDGVTLVAQFEQARPSEYPGKTAGVDPKPMILFNLDRDPAETRDVSSEHPDVVQRMKAYADKILANWPEFERPDQFEGGLRRVTGGRMDFFEEYNQ
ncbi:MAG: sulfatase-like hydrolase/transferase [bacterium]|nr:sulfatase-like hydrolase/transferase [bacterium]